MAWLSRRSLACPSRLPGRGVRLTVPQKRQATSRLGSFPLLCAVGAVTLNNGGFRHYRALHLLLFALHVVIWREHPHER